MLRRYAFVLLLVATASGLHGMASQPPVPGLFVDRPDLAAVRQDAADRPDTVRARPAAVNLAALDQDAIDLSLFDGTTLRATLDRRSGNADGSASWSGRVDGDPFSAVTFVRAGNIVQGAIRTVDAAYTIEPLPDTALHAIRQVDLSQLGPELPPLVPPTTALQAAIDDPPMPGDDGTMFDVLVVYTPAAVAAAGSTSALLARITLGITETNTAYANSGIIPRLRLVGTELVTYTETGDLSVDLGAVTGTADGQMDSVHSLRNSLGADLVKLVVGNTAGTACGVAWLMQSLSSGFATNAFSVTAYPCISPNYTFGHELGHNMGSNHAPSDPVASPPLYAYSFGYKHPSNLFRTVMAYDCPVSCPRVLYFSNPSVNYSGAPTGTAAQNHNALSINNARSTVANWRQQAALNTPPTVTTPPATVIAEDASTTPLAFTVGDGQTAATGLVVTASSSNPLLVANSAAALALGGAGASRTVTVTPQPNGNGQSTITLSVNDGVLTTTTSFLLTVTAVNDLPVVSAIAAQSANEDQSVVVPFTVSDVETPASSLSLQAASTNTALVGGAGLVLGGSGTNRTLTLTPVADQWGTSTISVTVSDGTVSVPRAFSFTVLPVNDPPALSGIVPLVSTTIGVPISFPVTVSDPDSPSGSLSLMGDSWNQALLPNGGIAVAAVSSSATSRTFIVTLAPAAGQTGAGGLTLSASDSVATISAPISFTVTSVPTAPDAPTGLVSSAEGTVVTLTWTPALTGSAPTSFVVELGTAPGTTTLPTQTVVSPAARLSLALPAGNYYARVRAVNAVGQSAPSPEASVTVVEPSPIPGPPGNFSATTSGTTVIFTWTASTVGAAASHYLIEAGSAPGLANLATLDTGSEATSLDVPNVPRGTYWVRVRGANTAGTGAPSQDVSVVMGASAGCVGLPAAPVLLTPVVSGVNVSLSWNAPTMGRVPTGYVLFAGSASGLSNLASVGTGSAATSFAASAPAGVYFVRIAASNACGVGPVSNEVSFTLGMDLPGAPQNLAAFVAPDGLVTLTWDPPASAGIATSYLIEAGSSPGLADLATLSTGGAATVFNAAAPAGTYYVRVRAVNGGGASGASGEVVVLVP
jgi:Metallo-peptidase family M12B Reprolysin-like/Bacterial Ig domain